MRVKMETQVKCGEKSPYCFISKSKIGGGGILMLRDYLMPAEEKVGGEMRVLKIPLLNIELITKIMF